MLRGLGRQVSQRFVAASAGRSAGDLFGLRSFLRRLCAAFGWKYVAILASEYGVNQGTGLRLAGAARSYYLLDSVGMSSADYGHLSGFSHIPWQLKSVFGLLSDTVALGGLHRTPCVCQRRMCSGGCRLEGVARSSPVALTFYQLEVAFHLQQHAVGDARRRRTSRPRVH